MFQPNFLRHRQTRKNLDTAKKQSGEIAALLAKILAKKA